MPELTISLSNDMATLSYWTAQLDIDGVDDQSDVIELALGEFFQEHESVRHAAVARKYRETPTMTRGRAADLSDLSPGPEIVEMLRDHDVDPYHGRYRDDDGTASKEVKTDVSETDISKETEDDQESNTLTDTLDDRLNGADDSEE